MIQVEEEVPLCDTCGHHHVPGIKCSICGHVGKSNIFKKMKERAAAHYKFELVGYGTGLESGCDFSQDQDAWAILRELRGIYCRTRNTTTGGGGGDLSEEFNLQQERNSRHLLGYYGNRPLLVARYSLRAAGSEGGTLASAICLVDRFEASLDCEEHKVEYELCVQSLHLDIQSMHVSMQQHYGLPAPPGTGVGGAVLVVYVPRLQHALGSALCSMGYEAGTFDFVTGEADVVEHEGASFVGLRFKGAA